MPLDALDHLILDRRLNAALGAAVDTRELQQTLAKQAAANQGRKAIIDALVAAYNANDWQTIQAILGNYDTRTAIYQAAYFPTLQSMIP
ncbi:hypothetical protein E4P82_20550 [Candidatus Competibacter phosphatis]|uniref:Uncharacterized protein n=1 Tax=Candidatus Competibacter phosphatis TaxID=221280 RepID=A0ABX1TPL2_9GAMM|nr:hypothetical protein [Candidatus Competibacter phosphatis]NMQ21382.1 hypothetical protein [Candidatus Competibacter phosphatis]